MIRFLPSETAHLSYGKRRLRNRGLGVRIPSGVFSSFLVPFNAPNCWVFICSAPLVATALKTISKLSAAQVAGLLDARRV